MKYLIKTKEDWAISRFDRGLNMEINQNRTKWLLFENKEIAKATAEFLTIVRCCNYNVVEVPEAKDDPCHNKEVVIDNKTYILTLKETK